MAIITTTVTVNPAFLQEIKDDNRRLRELLCELEILCARDRWTSARRRKLALLLAQLGQQLAMHFTLEEGLGYFDEPVAAAPRLCRAAEVLRAEHEELLATARLLADESAQLNAVQAPSRRAHEIAEQFRSFHDRFRDHEARENELILQALDDDLGVGD